MVFTVPSLRISIYEVDTTRARTNLKTDLDHCVPVEAVKLPLITFQQSKQIKTFQRIL